MTLFHNPQESIPYYTFQDFLYGYEVLLQETFQSALTVDTHPTPAPHSTPQPVPQVLPSGPPRWQRVPQESYDHGRRQFDFRPSEPIRFQVNGLPGVNMGESFRRRYEGLEGRDDTVLEGERTAVTLRWWFPGYPISKSYQVSTKNWDGDRTPLIRSKLAYQVAKKLKDYLDSMETSHIMNPAAGSQWKIGEGFMTLDQMHLAKLEARSNGTFQAEIWVVDPTS